MSKFKIGDKVKILKKNDSYSNLWVSSMDNTQETEGIIVRCNPQLDKYGAAYDVKVFKGHSWWYEEGWLEKIEEEGTEKEGDTSKSRLPTTWNNIEVGDINKHDVSGTAYSVVSLGDDRAFITDDGDYIHYKDIVVVYKKHWEKPKELEEMSKEELIKLVKELKGGM